MPVWYQHSYYRPYAGAGEPRTLASWDALREGVIVEVGGSVDLWQAQWSRAYGNDGGGTGFRITVAPEAGIVAALPSTVATLGSSQTVDGLAGIAIALTTSMLPVPDMRLRFGYRESRLIGRIGDLDVDAQSASRRFVDLTIGHGQGPFGTNWPNEFAPSISGVPFRRFYGGVRAVFGGPATVWAPYIGFDATRWFNRYAPLIWSAGYEFGLDTEPKTIGEHRIRLGLRFARSGEAGVTLEGMYRTGRARSLLAPGERESVLSFGVGYEF